MLLPDDNASFDGEANPRIPAADRGPQRDPSLRFGLARAPQDHIFAIVYRRLVPRLGHA
jgi:hypothetical protein